MSFLLDALRKSEMERRVGELPRLTPDVLAKPEQPKRHPFILLIVVLILVNIATLSYLTLRSSNQSEDPVQEPRESTPPVPTSKSLANTTPNSASEIAEHGKTRPSRAPELEPGGPGQPAIQKKPMVTTIERAKDTNNQKPVRPSTAKTPAEIPRNRSLDTLVKRSSEARAEQNRTSRITPEAVPVKEPRKVRTNPLQIATAAKPLKKPESLGTDSAAIPRTEKSIPGPNTSPEEIAPEPASDAIPLLNGMPRDFQREVPSLNINVFVYSDDPAERFVIVNMSKYRTGQKIDNGPEIQEIRADSLVLNYLGRTFRIKRP